uniref:Transmembrane protein 198 n=1 Tax=Bos indicus x Bos taurus TaxID=30522 RepID=A0A4W2HPU8_BOBOX
MEEALLPLAMTSDPRPFNQQLPEPPDLRCVLQPQDNPDLAPALVCALCCCFGIIYCCFGYRCFKAVMFLSGLLSGALVIFLLCHKERVLETQLSLEFWAQPCWVLQCWWPVLTTSWRGWHWAVGWANACRHFQPCLLSAGIAGSCWGPGQPWGPLGPWPSGSSWMRNMEATPMWS